MPIDKRPDSGAYEVTVCFGGRTHRKSSRSWTYAEAKAYERDYLASCKAAAAGIKPEHSIADAMRKWLLEYVPRLAERGRVENHAKQLFPFIHNRKLSEAPKVWAEFKVAYADRAPATINHKGRILRQLCNLALSEWQWTDVPIGKRIKLLPEQARERFLTAEEVEALARACPTPAAGDYVRLAAYTGIRRGHLLRLTADDVQGNWIRLDRSSKTRTLQLVPLHARVQAIAARLPLPVAEFRLRTEWAAAREAVGIDCRWHDLRHTCASWLVQAGVSLVTVKEFLGHSTIAVTQRYAHLAPAHLQDAINRVA